MVASALAPWTMLARGKRPRWLAILFVLVPAVVAGAMLIVPFSAPMGGFWSDAQQFATTGHIRSVFTPCGYPALLGAGFRVAGTAGVVAVQLLVYATILLTLYFIFRLLEVERMSAAAASALLGLDPDLVISIKKIWDTDLTALLLMLLCAALLVVIKRGLSPARAVGIAGLWGLSITVRPNFPALVVPIAFALWYAAAGAQRLRLLWWSAVIVLLGSAATVAAVNTLVHGSFFLPQNGPYNLYAGDNAFTEQALLTSLNAEPSIYPSMMAQGFRPQVNLYSPELRPYYVAQALRFMRQNPLEAAKLALLKLGTLLRPDTKIYSPTSLAGAVKSIEALAFPAWLLTLFVLRHQPWGVEDGLFVMFAVAYIVPFVLTNADPRFRIPLDLLVLTHLLYRVARSAGGGNP